MSELLNFLLAVAIILIAAKASGYVSVRLGQPSVLGELLVGLLLGPTVLNMLSSVTWFAEDAHLTESLTLFAENGTVKIGAHGEIPRRLSVFRPMSQREPCLGDPAVVA